MLSQRTLSVWFVYPYVRSTKLDAVSLKFANDLALSSCFAFTKLLPVKDKAYLTTRLDKSQHLFYKVF